MTTEDKWQECIDALDTAIDELHKTLLNLWWAQESMKELREALEIEAGVSKD